MNKPAEPEDYALPLFVAALAIAVLGNLMLIALRATEG
jgi:hypothetical protein